MSTNPGLLGRVGSSCYRHRWITVLVWIAGVASLITLWTRFGAAAQNDFSSFRAIARLSRNLNPLTAHLR